MRHSLSADLELASACCRWPRTDSGDDRIREWANRVDDWSRFDAVVRRNRITPLVRSALSRADVELPDPVAQDLAARGLASARHALFLARETVRIQQAFEGAGMPVMILKGIPLAILAYGDVAMKESRDIDVLVCPGDAVKAQALLADLGHEADLEGLEPDQFGRFVANATEAKFVNRANGIIVDLHWRLAEHADLLRGIDAQGPAQLVPLQGGAVRTLADGALFSFLCLHGATHNWSRLKWLADLAAFVRARGESEVEALYNAAEGHGAGRCAAVALALCASLLDLPLSPSLRQKLRGDAVSRLLQANALAALRYGNGMAEHGTYSTPWFRMMAGQFFLGRGVSHAVQQAGIMWNSPTDRARLALPRPFGFLYHVLRIPLWLTRLGGRFLVRPGS